VGGRWIGEVTFGFVEKCASSTGPDGLYRMELDPFVVNGPGCIGGITETGTQEATTVFDVRVGDGGKLVVDDTVVTSGQTVMQSFFEHASSPVCNNRIYLMDKVVVSHTVRGVYPRNAAEPLQYATSTATFGDYSMNLISTSCSSSQVVSAEYNATTCVFKYESEECIPMVVPKTAPGTCGFEFKFGAFMGASAEMAGFSKRASLNVPIARKTAPSYACNTARKVSDVTSTVSARLTSFLTESDNGIQVELQDVGETTSRTLAITDVRITVGNMTRLFSLADKVRLMTVANTPYYDDVKYCRYINRVSRTASETCSLPFFNLLKAGQMYDDQYNVVDAASTNVGGLVVGSFPWLLPDRGYAGCDLISKRNIDRWLFNPTRWVFRDMGSQGVVAATVQVTSVLTTCGAAMPGRRLDEETLVYRPTFNFSLVLDRSAIPPPTPEQQQKSPTPTTPTQLDVPKVHEGLTPGAIAGIVIGSLLALVIGLYAFTTKHLRARARTPKKTQGPDRPAELGISI
jgi:hypothetical protein